MVKNHAKHNYENPIPPQNLTIIRLVKPILDILRVIMVLINEENLIKKQHSKEFQNLYYLSMKFLTICNQYVSFQNF